MVVKNGKRRLVGFVDLGPLHDDMLRLEGNMFPSIYLKCSLYISKSFSISLLYMQ